MTSTQDLVHRLERFGVPVTEGHLYLHLSRLGDAGAAELAREARVSRTDCYRILDQLQVRGLAEKTLERPARFIPVPIDHVLERLLRAHKRALEELADRQDALTRAWPRGQPLEPHDRRISTHQGRQQIQALVEKLITDSREDITIATPLRGIARLDLGRILDHLRDRRDAAIPTRVLTRVEPPDIPLAERLAEVATVRHLDLSEYHEMLIADNHSIALFVGGSRGRDPAGGPETLLHLTAPPFVLAQKALVDEAWCRGMDLADRAQELRSGAPAQRFELLRGRWVRTERLKQILYRNDRVTILAPANEVRRWGNAGVTRVLQERHDQGCILTILCDEASRQDPLPDLGVPMAPAPPTTRLVAVGGDSELLTVENCHDGRGPTDVSEWGLWTTVRSTVAAAALDLERARLLYLLGA